jgi:hypothetical protein
MRLAGAPFSLERLRLRPGRDDDNHVAVPAAPDHRFRFEFACRPTPRR